VQHLIEIIAVWLRQVITVLVLVRFVELVLPEGSIRRYARLVMGLVIMLAIVRPLLGLVAGGNDFLDISLPAAQAGGLGGADPAAAAAAAPREDGAAALGTVTAQQVRECQTEAVRRYVTERARQLTGHQPVAVDVILDPDDGGSAGIGGIAVTLAPESGQRADSSGKAPDGAAAPRPVEPVVIGPVRPRGVDAEGTVPSTATTDAAEGVSGLEAGTAAGDPAAAGVCAQVRDVLSAELGLPAAAVTVRVAHHIEEADGQ